MSAFGSVGSFSAGAHGRKAISRRSLGHRRASRYAKYRSGGVDASTPIAAGSLRYDFTEGIALMRQRAAFSTPSGRVKAAVFLGRLSNLAVGPVSTVTLDRFVFAGDSTYRQVTVNLVRRRVSLFDRQLGQARLQDQHTGGDDRRARHRPRYYFRTRPHRRNAQRRRRSCLHAQRRQVRDAVEPGRHGRGHTWRHVAKPAGPRLLVRAILLRRCRSLHADLVRGAFAAFAGDLSRGALRALSLREFPPRRAQALQNPLRRRRRAIAETGARTSRS